MKTTPPDHLTLDMTQADVNKFLERKLSERFGPDIDLAILGSHLLQLLDPTPAAPAPQQTGQTS